MLKRFVAYYRPHIKMFTLDMIASLFIYVIGMLYPILTKRMLDDFVPNKEIRMLVICGVVLLLLYLLRMYLRYFVQYWGHMVGVGMQAQMRTDLFRHLQRLPYTYFDNNETGKIMSRMTNDLMEVSELAHHGPENLLISGIMIVGSFAYLCTISVPLTLIIFSCVPLLMVVTAVYRKRMTDAFAETRKSMAVINAALESSISGIRVTKAFTNMREECEKFEAGNTQFIDARRDSYNAMAKFHSGSSFVTDVFNVVILIAGGIFLYMGRISFADYSTFIISVNLFINPVTTLIGFMEQYQNGVTGFKRFLEVLDEEPEEDAPGAAPIERVRGDITLVNVEFAYNEEKDVLRGVSLDIRAGQKIALVGPSGGGKTTLCHLIPAFYKSEAGTIFIDGRDIRDITLDSLRSHIGIVQQDVFLFNGTVRENILYGRPDATQEEIEAAAVSANIHEYIMSLPAGYDTEIGERGVRLSGGQKQRLSIARVFLKNPSILILDEATSALDNTTEILIQQALDALCRGRTTLVVAHRLSTIKNADEIVVIAGGRIEERGSHDALMALENGMYRKLYNLQFRDQETTAADVAFLQEAL
ncbi:MAG: ABC transporter ATP-binding protein [Clostridia bacterium]|nr:ABC transporter ATP-binding protein [Clostridia bacterium]